MRTDLRLRCARQRLRNAHSTVRAVRRNIKYIYTHNINSLCRSVNSLGHYCVMDVCIANAHEVLTMHQAALRRAIARDLL